MVVSVSSTISNNCPLHVKERFHFHNRYKDSVLVQLRRKDGCVHDDEVHEDERLKDLLKPHHTVHFAKQSRCCCVVTANDESDTEELGTEGMDDNSFLNHFDCEHETKPILPPATDAPILAKPARIMLCEPDCETRKSCQELDAKRKVQFKDVTLREYGVILGDHPNCSYGPPITIEWDYLEYQPLSVDEYELHHARRRTLRNMMRNYFNRKGLLLALGYSEQELKQATRQVNRVKFQRAVTKETLLFRHCEDALESSCRKIGRLLSRTKKSGGKMDLDNDVSVKTTATAATEASTQ